VPVSSESFQGRVVVISGASSGIGLAIARCFAEAGARVVGLDLKPPDESVENCRHVEVDVASFEEARRGVREVLATEGSIDCLVNNAGISRDATVWRMTEEEWDTVLAVDLKGPFNLIRHAAPHFREVKSGKIVNIASVNGLRGQFGLSNYSAAKAGLIALTKTVAKELGRYNVNVNAVAPGMVLTPLTRRLSKRFIDEALAEQVLKRLSTPEDVARLVLFLCTDAARQITGEVVRIDGGQYI
jgi:3-oxoacyl-[acyl-carrier protein] reductase